MAHAGKGRLNYRCQYVGNEEDVLKRNEVVRMKYGSMMKRYKMEDF